MKGWSWRGLTLLGKTQVIKSFAIPKILYRVVLISNKKEFIKKINTLLYSFVWKGKDKVKRTAFINPIDKGGLKMPNIESMISAQRIICIKRYLSTDPASWKLFLDFYLKKVGGKFLFHCNFNYTKLSVALPEFFFLFLYFILFFSFTEIIQERTDRYGRTLQNLHKSP